VTFAPFRLSRAHALLYGTLVVGLLDITDATVFFGLRNHVSPIRIFQSIARGLLGAAAYQGGLATAALGAFLHFFIACVVVAAYYAASTRVAVLTRRPVLCGVLYGIVVYGVMNLVVLPLSAAGRPAFVLPVVVNGLLIHMFGVGLPSALFARAGVTPRSPKS
jgi:hypothetical protein